MNLLFDQILPYQDRLFAAMKETLIMLAISVSVSFIVGLVAGIALFLTQKPKNKSQRSLHVILSLYVNGIRSFPFLILIVLIGPLTRWLIGTSFGTYAAAFPLSLVGIALYARLVEQAMFDIPKGILDVALSQGISLGQLIVFYLINEARVSLVLGITSVVISLISYSTVMGAIGGGGIGAFAMIYGYQEYKIYVVLVAVGMMLLLVSFIQWAGSQFAKYLDKR